MSRVNRVLLLLLTLLPSVVAPATAGRVLPPPRWQAPLYEKHLDYPHYVQCQPAGSALIFAYYSDIVALDRTTGRRLWQRKALTAKVIDGDLTKLQPLAPYSPANAADYAGETFRTYWQLLGTGNAATGGDIVLMGEQQTHVVHDDTQFNKQRTVSETTDEVAIQAATGQELWRRPIDPDVYFRTVLNDLIIESQGRNVEAQPGQPLSLRYRDLGTGGPLEPDSRQVQPSIRALSAGKDGTPALVRSFGGLDRIDLNAATAAYLYRARTYLLNYAVFASKKRIVFHNNLDDDGMGHSVWPRYVECTNLEGKLIWRFPRILQQKGVDDPATIREPYSIDPMAPCRATGTVLCVSDGPIGDVGKYYWYGLDVRDGHVKWRRAMDSNRLKIAELGRGFLFAVQAGGANGKNADHSALGWLDSADGKPHWITQTPVVANFFIGGDDLLLLDPQGNLRAYPMKTLIRF
jgi:outer membrane protein assembly factor BamB